MPRLSSERRGLKRQRKRLQVKFSGKGVFGVGFTGNLSPAGMHIQSRLTSAPGSILRGQILLPGSARMDFQAQVRWVHKATGPLIQLVQSTMGLMFVVPPSKAYFQLLPESQPSI